MSQDDKVTELLSKVKQKQEEIQKASRPQWKTSCSFGLDESSPAGRTNIQTISKVEKIVELAAFLLSKNQLLNEANVALGTNVSFEWLGYEVKDWLEDFRTRISQIELSTKKKDLAELESKLNKLVSPDKRRELELLEIEKLLS